MNQNKSAEWDPEAEEEAGDLNLQGIKFSPFPPPARRLEPKQENKALFVRNIPREVTNKELRQIFSEHGKVVSVFLKPNVSGAKYNWAIINVETVKDMLIMMSALNRKPPFNFDLSVALTEEEKKQRRRSKGDTSVPSSDVSSEDPWTIDKSDLDGLSSAGHTIMVAQGALNGGAMEEPQGLVNEEASQGYHGFPSEGKVQAMVPRTSRNESYEVGRGTVMMEGSRHQACVYCGSQGQMRCSVCKAWYCSMVCQVDDWYHHKDTCRSPPVLDDPRKVHRSLCGTGGEVSGGTKVTSDAMLPSFSSCADSCKKGLHRGMLEEAGQCSSPKKTLDKEIKPRGSIASCPSDEDTVLTKRNLATVNGCSSGAIPKKSTTGQNGHDVERGAIPKRSTVAPDSSIIGGYDGTFPKGSFETCSTAEGSFPVGHGLDLVPKVSLVTENGCVRGRGASLQRDVKGNFAVEKGLARGRAAILHRDVEGDPATEKGPGRGRAAILQMDVGGGCAVENGPARGRGAVLQRDMEQIYKIEPAASETNPAEILPPNQCVTESTPEEEEQLPRPATAKEMVTLGTVGGTPTDCLKSVKAAPSTDKDASIASPEVSLTKNVAEGGLNFASLLEKGKVYNGFITLVDSYKCFTAAVVVDGTEYIFSEAHEVFSTSPFISGFKPEVGSLVAAFSCIEETWYRAQVLEADDPKYKVCFIDFGNKEVVEKVKPVPKGPFAELPELAFSASFYSAIKDEFEHQLKKMVQVDNPIQFQVTAKKESSVKVILCEEDDESDTAVAEYILEPLLARSSTTSLPASAPASETKTIPPETKVISLETKGSSPETKGTSPETKAIFPEGKAASPDIKTISTKTRAASPGPLKDVNEDSSLQKGAPTTGQQEISLIENNKEEQLHVISGVVKEKQPVDADKDALKDCSTSQPLSRDVNSELSSSGAGKAPSFYVVPLNTLELMMKMEEMAVEMNKHCGSAPNDPHQPRHGEVCLAKFGQDDNWHRAACLALGSTSALVVFVDYGNVEKVLYADIRQIPKHFLELPCVALHHPRQDSDARGALKHCQTSVLSSFAFLSPLDLPPEGIIKME